MTHRAQDFLGTWSLQEWRIEHVDGRRSYPFGRQPTGLLIYAEHAMAASIQAPDRVTLDGSPRQAEVTHRAAWFDSYFNYSGSWWLEGRTVVHEVVCALNPKLVRTRQRRLAEFGPNGILILSASEGTGGEAQRRHWLYWQPWGV